MRIHHTATGRPATARRGRTDAAGAGIMDKLFELKPFGYLAEVELAWAAGLVDGEGCITITEAKPSGQYKSPRFNLVLIVTNTHEPTIRRLAEMFGIGSIRCDKGGGNEADAWRWSVSRRQAGWVIEALHPYIFTKSKDAELALEYCRLDNTGACRSGVPDWLNHRRSEIRHKIRVGKPQRIGPEKYKNNGHFT